MASKQIPFSEARQQLTSIIDEVEKSGKAVTIVRHGKPVAVIIDHATYERFTENNRRKKRTLRGSLIVKAGVDLDKALKKAKQERIRIWKLRGKKLAKLIRES
jgi:prevent-host-death family protein